MAKNEYIKIGKNWYDKAKLEQQKKVEKVVENTEITVKPENSEYELTTVKPGKKQKKDKPQTKELKIETDNKSE